MSYSVFPRREVRSRAFAAFVAAAAVSLAACSGGESAAPAGPTLPGDPTPTPGVSQAAFILDVNVGKREVKITPATQSLSASLTRLGIGGFGRTDKAPASGPSYNLLGGDVVDIQASNFNPGAVGVNAPPGKIRVTFDVTLINKLNGIELIRPGGNSLQPFPTPPSTTANLVYAFPFRDVVTTTTGGVSNGENEVIVELPNRGAVAPSDDWNGDGSTGIPGTAWNWFNDTDCSATPATGTASDCYRYEGFAAPIGTGVGPTRNVGYIIDPTVSRFRTYILVAADLRNAGPAVAAAVKTRVSSPQRGVLTGVTATINPGGFIGTTDGTAAPGYNLTIANVTGASPKSLTLSNLPSGCTAPAAVTVPGTTSTADIILPDISVTCTALSGTVSGSFTVNLTGGLSTAPSLAGATYSITNAVGAAVTGSLAANGAFSATVPYLAPSGAGTVSIAGLPAGCTPNGFSGPTAAAYTGLTSAAPQAVSFTISCAPPPSFYQLYSSWGAPSGGTIQLVFEIDMTTRNDPTDPQPDSLQTLQFDATFPVARLSAGADPLTGNFCDFPGWSVGSVGVSQLASGIITPGVVSPGRRNVNPTPRLRVGQCTFNITGTGPTPATSTITNIQANIKNGTGSLNVNSFVQANNGSTTIP